MRQLLLLSFLVVCFIVMNVSPARMPPVRAAGASSQLLENVTIKVNCTVASLSIMTSVTSSNASLMHFPIELNLTDSALINVTTIEVTFSAVNSVLVYLFENIDETAAKNIADGFTTSISSAFSTSFGWLSTGTSDGVVNVTYSGLGKLDLPLYVQGLVSQCLAPDLGGFSLTLEPMCNELGAYTTVAADKAPGGFDWTWDMMTGYSTPIATGSGNHLIDVLDLLNVAALGPSNYAAEPQDGYSSQVLLTVSSDLPMGYVSSQPNSTTNSTERGWFVFPIPLPHTFVVWFYFGTSPAPESPLTLTFSGTIVPELTTAPLFVLFLVSATTALAVRKRLSASVLTRRPTG